MIQTSLAAVFAQLGRYGEALPLLETAGSGFEAIQKRLRDNPDLKHHIETQRKLLAEVRAQRPRG
jgi:hypothetical protein